MISAQSKRALFILRIVEATAIRTMMWMTVVRQMEAGEGVSLARYLTVDENSDAYRAAKKMLERHELSRSAERY